MAAMTQNEIAARKKARGNVGKYILLIVLLILFIFPFVLVVINVFKTKADITINPLSLIGAHGFTLANFPNAMEAMDFWRVFLNSVIVTVSATILTVLFSAMCAFVIARHKNWKACAILFTMMNLRRHLRRAEPQVDADSAPCRILRVHGDIPL